MAEFRTINDFDTFDILIEKVKNYKEGEKLYYNRFGDGCFIMMYPESLNQTIGKSNRFFVTEKFRKELRDSYNIEDDNYMVASCFNLDSPQSTDANVSHPKILQMIDDNILVNRREFYSHPTFECNFMQRPEKFKEFFNLIYDKKKVWVNQFWHDNIEKIIGNVEHHVQTPSINSYSNIDEWYPELLETLDDVEVVILASGQSSRILCGRLWNAGVNKLVIDIGSVADMFISDTWIFDKINLRSTMRVEYDTIRKSLEYMLNEK